MKPITTVLRESEAMAARKAVCAAGGERVVVTPLTYRMCGIDTVDIYSDKLVAEVNKQVRLDVIADDNQSGGIVSAIRRIAHHGKIVLASRLDRQPGCAA